MMSTLCRFSLGLLGRCGTAAMFGAMLWTSAASAAIIVEDTWQDGERLYPFAAAPSLSAPSATFFAETNPAGTPNDADADTDIESMWFRGGAGTLDPLAAGGPMRGTGYAASSASWSTYFTPESNEVTLANAGEALRLTWVFKTGDVNLTNASQSLRLGLVDSGASAGGAARPTSNTGSATPGGAMDGFAIFANMGETLGAASAFQLKARSAESAFLSAGADWSTNLANDGTTGDPGYLDNSVYTLVWTITRNATNTLDIVATMSGPNLGTLEATSLNTPWNGAGDPKFDLFGIRPSNTAQTSDLFDTSLFRVELIPEPTTCMLLGLGVALAGCLGRRR
jgi:hypothetical protein